MNWWNLWHQWESSKSIELLNIRMFFFVWFFDQKHDYLFELFGCISLLLPWLMKRFSSLQFSFFNFYLFQFSGLGIYSQTQTTLPNSYPSRFSYYIFQWHSPHTVGQFTKIKRERKRREKKVHLGGSSW